MSIAAHDIHSPIGHSHPVELIARLAYILDRERYMRSCRVLSTFECEPAHTRYGDEMNLPRGSYVHPCTRSVRNYGTTVVFGQAEYVLVK
jgi:hypothetical protein